MRPILKICGITEIATLEEMDEANLPIDQVGFVFAASRRKVNFEQWRELASYVPQTARAAGVFVNPSLAALHAAFEAAPLAVVQLHGEEDPAFCKEIRRTFGCQVTKTFSIREQDTELLSTALAAYAGCIDYVLLDTAVGTQLGGTGKAFAWERITPYQKWSRAQGVPLLVAGGVHANNVGELLEKHRPDGVDISSGAETDGHKDINKIRTIIERMSEYEQSTVE
ncbi:phosphoribosylanthranilate isomerase [Aneurinibacillus sp. REN35]|uniref:phosphoribosylanthranilate isomerase n=1 Tax=Aneurinibacillus sp. REN35 TaxID=3237286 RepID=UPI0035294E2C